MTHVLLTAPTCGAEDVFTKKRGFEKVTVVPLYCKQLPADVDVVCFTGGADINPALYGEEPHHTTYFTSYRDRSDILVYAFYKHLPKIGICRGAQFLCALNGGKLWQDVDKHGYEDHEVITKDDRCVLVTSVHHQMCRLKKAWPLLAWTNITSYKTSMHGVSDTADLTQECKDPEAFYIPEDKAYCVQYHPEFQLSNASDTQHIDLFFAQMKEVLG